MAICLSESHIGLLRELCNSSMIQRVSGILSVPSSVALLRSVSSDPCLAYVVELNQERRGKTHVRYTVLQELKIVMKIM